MLRTNSKEVKAKVRQYIMDGFEPEAYGYEQYYNVDKENFSCVAHAIYECLYTEKIHFKVRKLQLIPTIKANHYRMKHKKQ